MVYKLSEDFETPYPDIDTVTCTDRANQTHIYNAMDALLKAPNVGEKRSS